MVIFPRSNHIISFPSQNHHPSNGAPYFHSLPLDWAGNPHSKSVMHIVHKLYPFSFIIISSISQPTKSLPFFHLDLFHSYYSNNNNNNTNHHYQIGGKFCTDPNNNQINSTFYPLISINQSQIQQHNLRHPYLGMNSATTNNNNLSLHLAKQHSKIRIPAATTTTRSTFDLDNSSSSLQTLPTTTYPKPFLLPKPFFYPHCHQQWSNSWSSIIILVSITTSKKKIHSNHPHFSYKPPLPPPSLPYNSSLVASWWSIGGKFFMAGKGKKEPNGAFAHLFLLLWLIFQFARRSLSSSGCKNWIRFWVNVVSKKGPFSPKYGWERVPKKSTRSEIDFSSNLDREKFSWQSNLFYHVKCHE